VERELRYQLSQLEYQNLLNSFKFFAQQTKHLKNFYFDDPGLSLRRRRISLRLRTIKHPKRAVVTLKYPPHEELRRGPIALKVRNEFEAPIAIETASKILRRRTRICDLRIQPIRILRELLPSKDLTRIGLQGSLETVRSVLNLPFIGALELDRCKVFGTRFYELEVETQMEKITDRRLRAWLKYCGIRPLPSRMSKSARFYEELGAR